MRVFIGTALCFLLLASTAQAAITVDPEGVGDDDVTPSNPITWDASTEAHIGDTSTGNLAVTNGSHLISDTSYVGYGPNSSGTVTLMGNLNDGSSKWNDRLNVPDLYIGYDGYGCVNAAYSRICSSFSSIGHNAGSTGVVTISGFDYAYYWDDENSIWVEQSCRGRWDTGYLYIGNEGNGTLEITSGAIVNSGYSYIGYGSQSVGTVTVSGCEQYNDGNDDPDLGTIDVPSTWLIDHLHIGAQGTGTLNIANDGEVSGDSVYVGVWENYSTYNDYFLHCDGTGEINFNNGTLEITGSLVAGIDDLNGTGEITTRGLIVDASNITFDDPSDLEKNIIYSGTNKSVDITWTQSSSGEYFGAGNSATGSISITNGVSINSSQGYIGLQSGSTGEITVTGTDSTWTSSRLSVGHEGTGTLNVTNGGTASGSGYIGYASGSSGVVNVTGSNSTYSGALHVGYEGSGTLNISNGGTVNGAYYDGTHVGSATNATGEVNVSGNGSSWTVADNLYIGNEGTGSLNIEEGGEVNSGNSTYIGYSSDAMGSATIDGASSSWTANSLYVGYDATGDATTPGGYLEISNGASVSSASVLIGSSAGTGEVLVTGSQSGSDSTLTCGSLGIGDESINEGTGILEITNGGKANSSNTYIHDGTILVDGTGSTLTNAFHMYVGFHEGDDGSLELTNGGTVKVNTSGGAYDTYFIAGRAFGSTGNVSVESGSTLITLGHRSIGLYEGSTGIVTVDGAGSTWTHIDGSTSTTSNLFIGREGSGTLNITNGGAVINTRGNIGHANLEGTGTVTVDGSGSTWTCLEKLYVDNGTLDITDGGVVTSTIGYIATLPSSTVIVNVDGTGSTWSNIDDGSSSDAGKLFINYGSELNITDGGEVNCVYCDLDNACAVTVDGTDSGLISSGSLEMSNGSTLEVTNGGVVSNTDAAIYGSGSTVTVTGYESTWTNSGALQVNTDSSITINDGGTVSNTDGYVGYSGDATVTVGDTTPMSGATWTNDGHLYAGVSYNEGIVNILKNGHVVMDDFTIGVNGAINLDGGTLELTGSFYTSDHLDEINFTDGRIMITGGTVTTQSDTVLEDGKSLTVSNSTWGDGSHNMYVDNGSLLIDGGGTVSSVYGRVGYGAGSIGNATIDGDGSNWTNSADLRIGTNSGAGGMSITNGGAVSNDNGYIGDGTGSVGGVTVGESGSTSPYVATWTNRDSLLVGYNGGTGILNIYDQGSVSTSSLSIGTGSTVNLDGGTLELTGDMNFYDWDGTFNFTTGEIKVSNGTITPQAATNLNNNQTLTVTGSNSVWTDSNDLIIGDTSTGTLDITNGGSVTCADDSFIGYASGSTGEATVSGSGSTWTNNDYLIVGRSGTGTLNIESGADVTNAYAHLGDYAGSTGTANVDGTGSTWTTANLYIGSSGTGTLNATNGGAVSSTLGFIGRQLGSTGEVNVNGSGSTWTTSSYLYVGHEGAGTLNITNGGSVTCADDSFIGYASGSTGEVTVSGSGSTWTNNDYLFVGYEGTGTLDITNGGSVTCADDSFIGYASGSTGEVTVNGSGSTWTNNDYLFVGYDGTGTLNIENGADVTNAYAHLGGHTNSNGTVNVDGTNSTWTNANLYVGTYGTGILNVTNGGAVSCNLVSVGRELGSTGEVTVSGSGSTWINSSDLYVGYNGTGELEIYDGGLVSVAGTLTIDYNNDADSFIQMSDDGMLAVYGDADDSLSDFLTNLVSGTDAIQWWDDVDQQWELLATATEGTDYSLAYQTSGDLTGYTLLTVMAEYTGAARAFTFGWDTGSGETAAVPEPSVVALILTALATFGLGMRKRG